MTDTLLLFRANEGALYPVSPDAKAFMAKLDKHERVFVKVDRSRSGQQHRLFFAILTHVAEASEFETAERLLVWCKVRLGRYDLMKMPGYATPQPYPHSISFSAMKQSEFQRFFNDSIRVICEEVIPGTNSDELIADVEVMLAPKEPERVR